MNALSPWTILCFIFILVPGFENSANAASKNPRIASPWSGPSGRRRDASGAKSDMIPSRSRVATHWRLWSSTDCVVVTLLLRLKGPRTYRWVSDLASVGLAAALPNATFVGLVVSNRHAYGLPETIATACPAVRNAAEGAPIRGSVPLDRRVGRQRERRFVLVRGLVAGTLAGR